MLRVPSDSSHWKLPATYQVSLLDTAICKHFQECVLRCGTTRSIEPSLCQLALACGTRSRSLAIHRYRWKLPTSSLAEATDCLFISIHSAGIWVTHPISCFFGKLPQNYQVVMGTDAAV